MYSIAFFAQEWWFISDWDDYFYKFIITDSTQSFWTQLDDGTHRMIKSFDEILVSQYNHYLGSNGRFIVHCIVQTCTSLVPLRIYAFLNSVIFGLLLLVLVKLTDRQCKIWNTLFTILALVIGCPIVMAIFWGNIAVSVNYLWSGAIVFVWYYIYEKIIRDKVVLSNGKLFAIALFGVVAGSMQESFSMGLCAGLLIYHLFTIKKMTFPKLVIIGSFGLGACFSIFAPSNFLRAQGRVGLQMDSIWYLVESPVFVVFLLLCLACIFFARKRVFLFARENTVLLIAFITTLTFSLMIFNGEQQLTMVKLLSLILSLRLLYSFELKNILIIKKLLVLIGVTLCLISYPIMYTMRKELGESYYEVERKTYKSKSRVIVDTKHDDAIYRIEQSIFAKYYNITPIDGAGSLSIYISEGRDRKYLEGVIPVSMEEIKQKCDNNSDKASVTHIRNNTYAFVLKKKYNPENVRWKFLTVFHNPYKLHESAIGAQFCIKYEDSYYYIFKSNSKITRSEKIEIADQV